MLVEHSGTWQLMVTCTAVWVQACPLHHSVADNNQALIGQQGGIQVIVQSMKDHSSSAEVQENACGALWNLAANGNMHCSLGASMSTPSFCCRQQPSSDWSTRGDPSHCSSNERSFLQC